MYASEEVSVQLPLPSLSASPEEVREYIAHTLIVLGHLESQQAHSIAAKWRLGTGQESRQYPSTLYRDVFGHEDTWTVYRHIRSQVLAEERAEARAAEGAREEAPVPRRLKSKCLVPLENPAVPRVHILSSTCRLSRHGVSLHHLVESFFGVQLGDYHRDWLVSHRPRLGLCPLRDRRILL